MKYDKLKKGKTVICPNWLVCRCNGGGAANHCAHARPHAYSGSTKMVCDVHVCDGCDIVGYNNCKRVTHGCIGIKGEQD